MAKIAPTRDHNPFTTRDGLWLSMNKSDFIGTQASPKHGLNASAMIDRPGALLVGRESSVVMGPYRDAERVDAVAGSEFVDDRIRLLE